MNELPPESLASDDLPDVTQNSAPASSEPAALTPVKKEEKPRRDPAGFYEMTKTIVLAVLFALAIRSFAYQPFTIPSGSMLPTLLVGDYLFVSKFSYGFSGFSLPLAEVGITPPHMETRLFGKAPQRGDVIVFKLPANPSIDYIKRLIGLPGDRIQMIDGVLHINGVAVPRESPDFKIVTESGNPVHVTEYTETLPNGVRHIIRERSDDERLDNTPEFTVPEGHYFMMGDNRDNSQDSRDPNGGVGFVPAENLVGRADILFFSLDEKSRFYEVWNWPWALRIERLFNVIH